MARVAAIAGRAQTGGQKLNVRHRAGKFRSQVIDVINYTNRCRMALCKIAR
jgi:hypothetical protein